MAQILEANESTIAEAAAVLRAGGTVAFPTETVYGLGANALDPRAVQAIFDAKGRPAGNPLIVHVGSPEEIEILARGTERAAKLVGRFWPGPLTVVLNKKRIVPGIVTAGGPTVAIRMPAHPVALALIRKAGVPLAAPSANRSEHISPTQAEHVAASLGDAVDIVLDGGPCQVGLESTVLDLTRRPAVVLRPGMISSSELAEALAEDVRVGVAEGSAPRSPGLMPRHYAPRTRLTVIARADRDLPQERPLGLMAFGSDAHIPLGIAIDQVIVMPAQPAAYAARLYSTLYELDRSNLAAIAVEDVPDSEPWLAVRDRLARASGID